MPVQPNPDPNQEPKIKPAPEQQEHFVVRGVVRQADGAPIANVTVRAFDKDLPSLNADEPLGKPVQTNANGFYEIDYSSDQFSRVERGSADLLVRAYDQQDNIIAESAVLFNAPTEAVIDLVAQGYGKLLSEYERVLAAVTPLIAQIPIAELTEQDIDFLAGETGLERQWLALFVLACHHSSVMKTKLDPAVFYGLMREGLPTELAALLAQSYDVQRATLKRAVADNIIPAVLLERIEDCITELKALSVRVALHLPDQDQPSPLSTVLSNVLPVELQISFLLSYNNHQGQIEEFWTKLRQKPEFAGGDLVDQLQYTLQLAALTGGNASLVQLISQDKKLKSTRDLVGLDTQDWQTHVKATAGKNGEQIPGYIKGSTVEEKTANYAGSIVETLRAAFPMAYVAKGLSKPRVIDLSLVKQVLALNEGLDLVRPLPDTLKWGDMPPEEQKRAQDTFATFQSELAMFPELKLADLLTGNEFTNPIRAGVQQVLHNDPAFDFGAVNIDEYLQEHKDKLFSGIDDKLHELVLNQLKAMQRVYQVTPRYEEIEALMSAGITSAAAIACSPPELFTAQMGQLVGNESALFLYESADRIYNETLSAYGALASIERDLTVRVIGEAQLSERVRATYPRLFGTLNLCECEHCRSVYSPAAYLVDLLHFLERGPIRPTVRGPARALDYLKWRRPDILHIPLTCENTNTLIPYIDLVNEILEAYIVNNRLLDQSLGDVGTATSEELLASPQHLEEEAYTALKSALFPFILPFDRHLETVRVYLEHLGTNRYALMRTFQRNRPLSTQVQTDLALEYLKIGPDESYLLTGTIFGGSSPHTLAQVYGYSTTADGLPPAELETVAVFLEHTGLSYEELTQMLRTHFINPEGPDSMEAVVIANPNNSCDTGGRYLRLKRDLGLDRDRSLTSEHWDRLQSFIRLWRRLKWSILDVDRALAALGAIGTTSFDLQFLRRLGQTVQLRDELRLSLSETLSLWANIDTFGDDEETRQSGSLYARLFLNRTVRNLAAHPRAFELPTPGEVPEAARTISANHTAIEAALRLTAAELEAIKEKAGLNNELILANLSALQRYATLARTLRITVRDLLNLETLSGINPFAFPLAMPTNPNPTQQEGTARFVELARKVQLSGFSIALLNYLYRHHTDFAHGIGMRPERLVELFTSLHTELSKIAQDAGNRDERTRRLLAAVMNPTTLEEAVGSLNEALNLINGTQLYTVVLSDPPTVTFPHDFEERVHYSVSTHQLSFTGAMTSDEQRVLRNLSRATRTYQNAIDNLFEQPRTFIRNKMSGFFVVDEAINELIERGGASTEAAVAARHRYIDAKALDFLCQKVVFETLSGVLGLDVDLIRMLLTHVLHTAGAPSQAALTSFLSLRDLILPEDRPITSTDFPAGVVESFVRLHKASLLITNFRITSIELDYLTAHAAEFGGFNLNDLPVSEPAPAAATAAFVSWERLYNISILRDSLSSGDDLVRIWAATSMEAVKETLLNTTGWDSHALDSALSDTGFNVTDLTFFASEVRLLDLVACLNLAKQIGIAPARLFTWAAASPDTQQAQEVQSLVKAKYEAQEWFAIAKHLNDPLREQRRNALVAYVLTLPTIRSWNIHTAEELFEYFLIDVEMNACMATSRIKQAISSVQLFIQRCFMNLEEGVPPNTLRADWWKWMNTYRIWEANRKVFLYPENWIEPELRDDKSPFFKDLENELLQNDVTDETTEEALLNYLEKLDEVARLDIRGMYWEHESELTWEHQLETVTDGQTVGDGPSDAADRADILHVFGRTRGVPPIYYYRRLIDRHTWTPWEKVQIDIEGDHLIPVVYNRRLYLFWPLFRETTDPEQPPPQEGQPASQAPKKLEIKLAWSEYKDGKWSAKKTTTKKILTEYLSVEDRSLFYFETENENRLIIRCRWEDPNWALQSASTHIAIAGRLTNTGRRPPRTSAEVRELLWRLGHSNESTLPFTVFPVYNESGYFEISSCNDQEMAVSENRGLASDDVMLQPAEGFTDNQMSETVTGALILRLPENIRQWTLGLPDAPIPIPFQLLHSRQYSPYLLQAPFFYQDRERTYFVTPEMIANVITQIKSSSKAKAGIFYLTTPLISSAVTATSSNLGATAQATGIKAANPSLTLQGINGVSSKGLDNLSLKTAYRGDTKNWTKTVVCPGDRSRDYQNETNQEGSNLKLRFHTFYHPYICEFVSVLKRRGVSGLLALDNQILSDLTENGELSADPNRTVFKQHYNPTDFVDRHYPQEDVDFEDGAYALYNWELFFHIPLLIATRLSANQRFNEARRWFHFVFDPTTDSTDPIPQRFWKTLPFYRNGRAPQERIEELLRLLSYRGEDPELNSRREQVEAQVRKWREDPFNPHLIARMRPTAYQKTVVMKYIDNLIAWGDQLFQQDTIETINQATQLYVLAYLMLGERPKIIPPSEKPAPQSYSQLRPMLDDFSNALIATENAVAGRSCAPLNPRRSKGTAGGPTLGTLYFCVPHNDKLLSYWDTIEDRLFKIRNCLNIEGVARQLPLFEPPIDPALLVRAQAAGVDLRNVLNDINAPLPYYRFTSILQKSLELCAEVRSLGAALLGAYEKKDAEELALLRSTHEMSMLEQVRVVRQKQVEEAEAAIAGLEKSKIVVQGRQDYYQSRLQVTNPQIPSDILTVSTPVNQQESTSLVLLKTARDFQLVAGNLEIASSIAYIVPNFTIGSNSGVTFGGSNIGAALQGAARTFSLVASEHTYLATNSSTMGSYVRRAEEWQFQADQATKELNQIDKQIAAAHIRKAISEQELSNHELQIEQTKVVDEFMRSRKFTRKELYDWMVSQTSMIYFQAYKLAYDMAKKAERAYQLERGVTSSNFVRFDAWDSLHKGLLAGERLILDLKRLEAAYLDQHKRDYEITKNISLVLHAPLKLIELKTTGKCIISLPETLFDADYPGHYMRRIKSVSLTIPAVVGPYTSINCTLTLLNSRVRTSPTIQGNYTDDSNYTVTYGAIQSIATSHAQNDSGMFELNFRDERYLPFEYAGAISEWQIDLPPECNAFDFNSITEVVLRVNYIARAGGQALQTLAQQSLQPGSGSDQSAQARFGSFERLFSLHHEYATEWFRFIERAGAEPLRIELTPERFPFQFRGMAISIQTLDIFVVPKQGATIRDTSVSVTSPTPSLPTDPLPRLTADSSYHNLPHVTIPVNSALGNGRNYLWQIDLGTGITINNTTIEDIWIICTFSAARPR